MAQSVKKQEYLSIALLAICETVMWHLPKYMKQSSLILIVIFCLNVIGICQTEFKEDKTYKVWVYKTTEPIKEKGYLYSIKDSSIVLINSQSTIIDSSLQSHLIEIDIRNIQKIEVRRNGSIWRDASIGAVTGLLFGSLIAITQPGEGGYGSEQAKKYIYYGGSMAIVGLGVGALIGTRRVKFKINGDLNSFEQIRMKLAKISIE